ncbi:MAG: hypothetical protein QOK10_1198 [Pseudonocardiales bacterium]|jgi:uncharacterized protein (TIGR02246 family)|nr:hypothetical protein [Pseudonocardiales bacterium]
MSAEQTALTPDAWIEQFAQAWRDHDADLVASLFVENGRLYISVLDQPVTGREAIRAMWKQGTANQSDCDVTYGKVLSDGNRSVVEWWANVKNSGQPTTEPGCAVLHFNDAGLCVEMREYSALRSEHIPLREGWLDF